MKRILHFLAWRNWGVVRTNPVLENTFVFFYLFLEHHQSFGKVAPTLTLFLGLIFVMASYGYLLNDAVDCPRDVGHGIDNVFRGYTSSAATAVVLLAFVCTLPFVGFFSSRHPLFLFTWLLWLICTSLYSLPYVYLKGRGLLGLTTVALALRTLPIALILVVFNAQPDIGSLIILIYLTLRGLSGDLSHQITDYENDRVDGLGTYVVNIGLQHARTLLDRILEIERVALILMCTWIFFTLSRDTQPARFVSVVNFGIVIVLTSLAGYAGIMLRNGARGHDPHAPVYPVKDVFYLLHKTIPKIVLPLYLLIILIFRDWQYVALLVPLAIYFRLYSLTRITNALRLRPDPRSAENDLSSGTGYRRD